MIEYAPAASDVYIDYLFINHLELIIGEHSTIKPNTGKVAFTKWCPQENGLKTLANAEAAVDLALKRMNRDKIDLMQCEQTQSPWFDQIHRLCCD